MILAELLHVNSEYNMVTEALQTSRLANREAENSIRKESFLISRQDSKRRHGSNGTIATPYDENCINEHMVGVSSRDATEVIDTNIQPDVVFVCESHDVSVVWNWLCSST